jgi:hypothetical protein
MKTIIYINGVGRSEKSKNFSTEFQKQLGPGFKHIEFSWQASIENLADNYLQKSFKKPTGIHWKKKITYKLRSLLFDYAVDATAYPSFKDEILNNLYDIVKDEENVSFVCHSLGGLIAYDFMERYKSEYHFDEFITMGCSIPFFKLGQAKFWVPGCHWYNFYEPNDVLSMPVKPLVEGDKHSFLVTDIVFKSRHLFKSWNIASHNSYWRSNDLVSEIRKIL